MSDYTKNILITGATSGIGRGVVDYLLECGDFNVYGIGRDTSKVESLKNNKSFFFFPFDLSKIDSIEIFFKESFKDIKFDGFVHCAGIEETLPISLYTPDRISSIFAINVFSAIEILRFISKKKNSMDGASFVLLSSVMGELGQAGKVGYCSSKAALLGVVNSLSLELSKRKIRINAVSPGIVNTPLTDKLFSQVDNASVDHILNMHPLGIGEISDVVSIIYFLLSNNSRWITGQNIKIDGGYSTQ